MIPIFMIPLLFVSLGSDALLAVEVDMVDAEPQERRITPPQLPVQLEVFERTGAGSVRIVIPRCARNDKGHLTQRSARPIVYPDSG
jgi:hypothetical protein